MKYVEGMCSFCTSLAMKGLKCAHQAHLWWGKCCGYSFLNGGQFGAAAEESEHQFSEGLGLGKQKELRASLG